MKLLRTLILSFISMNAFSQAWVWEKQISTDNNLIVSDPLDNIIYLSVEANATSVNKYTKDGLLIWSRSLTKSGIYSPGASIVTDHNGNIYTHTEGFDSVNSEFQGVKPRGITKFSPQGNILWHVNYYTNAGSPTSPPLNKFSIQVDDNNNIYAGYFDGGGGVNVTFGNLTATTLGQIYYMTIASVTSDGVPRWVRAFRFNDNGGGLVQASDFSIAGNKLFVSGYMGKYRLTLDNGLIIESGRCTAWLAGFNSANGQSIWGRSHDLYVYCNGMVCGCSAPSLNASTYSGRLVLTNSLNGGFLFNTGDTIASITATGQPTVKNYYTIYDTLGSPVKGKTIQTVPNQFQYGEKIVGNRNNFFYSLFRDTLRKMDTGYNIIWQRLLNDIYVHSVYIPKNSNDILFAYYKGSNYYLAKMIDSAAVISGVVYADWDNNASYSSTSDSLLSNILITSGDPHISALSSRDSGKYYMYTLPGNYNLQAHFDHPHYEFIPSSYAVNMSQLSDVVSNKDFRLRPLSSFTDVRMHFTPLGIARPGRPAHYTINVKNFGTTPVAAEVGIKLPPLTTFNGINGGTVTINSSDSITISLGTLNPFAIVKSTLSLEIATTATFGDTLRFFPKAYPYVTDLLQYDNTDTVFQAIRTSFDPNEKEVNKDSVPIEESSKALEYTIRFQNTGNDTAFYVRIADTLSNKLDPSTFSFVDASHPVSVNIKENILSFVFNPISLPDSNINEPLSHGYVKFKITPLNTVTIADTIYNRSAIYFDFNPPVITNEATTSFYSIVVPVKLLSFITNKRSSDVQLQFITASEPNLENFTIEKSTNGIDFYPIGNVLAKGSFSTGASYLFTDTRPVNGMNFYRLRMTDFDRTISFSWIAAVNFANASQEISIFPNPASENIFINFVSTDSGEVFACTLMDVSGKIWKQINTDPAIRNTWSINVFDLPNGIYFIELQGVNKKHVQKILVSHSK